MLVENDDKKVINDCLSDWGMRHGFYDREIVVFGCTMYARDVRDWLTDRGYDISAFVDNSAAKQGIKCLGKSVYPPENYVLPYRNDLVVIVCARQRKEMSGQLRSYGYGEAEILEIPVKDSCKSRGDGEEELSVSLAEVGKGYSIYERIISEHTDSEYFFLCPYPGTGDIYMACIYLPTYLEKENISEFTILVIGKNCEKVLWLFDIEKHMVISVEESRLLLKAWEFYGCDLMKLKPLLYWGWRTKCFLNTKRHPQITFSELFRYDVFRLGQETPIQRPKNQCNMKRVSALFQLNGWRKGRTVILAPYAGSFISEMSASIWKNIAEVLTERGYDVCTNCYGDELPVEGTKTIQFSYEDGIGTVEYAGGFVGLRSGLCDVLSGVRDCKFVVLYEAGFSATNIAFFGLKNMGLSDTAIELVYEDDILQKLLNFFPAIQEGRQ